MACAAPESSALKLKTEHDSKEKEGTRIVKSGTSGVESQSEEFRILLENGGVLKVFEYSFKNLISMKVKREHFVPSLREDLRKHAFTHRRREAMMNEISFLKKQLKPYQKKFEPAKDDDEELYLEL